MGRMGAGDPQPDPAGRSVDAGPRDVSTLRVGAVADRPMKALARRVLARVRLQRPAGRVYRWLLRTPRRVRGIDRRIAKRYLAQASEPKLHIGCGAHLLDGWLNSDLCPRSANVMRLDATRRFPFADDTFAFVYCEHGVNYLGVEGAAAMLGECFRTLAPGGRARISTPDMAFLSDLCEPRERTELERRYVDWFSAQTGAPGGDFDLDSYESAWGFRFCCDEPTLREAMEAAGFSHVARCGLNRSDAPALRGLANERRMPEGFLQLESLTLEGVKPMRYT